jgi:hypothetical protein
VFDPADLGARADLLISEGIGTPADRNELIARLSQVKPGSKIQLRFEEPNTRA